MKRYLSSITGAVLCAIIQTSAMYADAPAGYYSSLEGKTGTALKAAVKNIVRKHTVISYGDNTWNAFRSTDIIVIDGKECWWDMYSTNRLAATAKINGMNIEHSVPNSWWGGTKNDAYKDIVHLNPSDKDGNSRKSNFPLTELSTKSWTNGAVTVGKPKSGQGGGSSNGFEPADEYKGDFARAYMYMFVTYDDINWGETSGGQNVEWMFSADPFELKDWAKELLLRWSANDAVSEKERKRNDGVYKEQKNRNPFIDLPDLAEYIWGDKSGQPYHVDGEHGVDPVNPVNPNPVEPDPVDPTAVAGTYVLVASQGDIRAGEQYIILSRKSGVAMSTELTDNGSKAYFKPTSEISISGNTIKTVPSNTAIISLESSGSRYALRMSDISGKDLGYLFSSAEKHINLTGSKTTEGVDAALTFSSQGVSVCYGESETKGSGALYYNSSSPRFTTYTSTGQEHLDLYRKVRETSAVEEIEESLDDSCFVEVWGNNILVPDGARIFDLNGREFSGENLARGIYIVTSPRFNKAVKVMIK